MCTTQVHTSAPLHTLQVCRGFVVSTLRKHSMSTSNTVPNAFSSNYRSQITPFKTKPFKVPVLLQSEYIQAYLRIKLLTGMPQGDLLRLQPELHIKDDGIHNQRHKTAKKTGKRTIYQWSPELRAAVDMALEARPRASEYLFCNRDGEGYINEDLGRASGWKSMWQRFMIRVLEETKVKVHFTEHDLRAKVASDATTLEHARALLAHADSRTTDKIYRRKPEQVATGKKTE